MLSESIAKLVQYGITTGLTPECERNYTTNLLLDVFHEDDYEKPDNIEEPVNLEETLDELLDEAVKRGLIEDSIVEEPPLLIREGGIIKEGFNETIDSMRNAKTEGKNWLAQLEEQDRERTGIKNLRIKYNKVFGYYFEVTNSFKDLVPEDYIRKQTLTNAERYTTDRLKELEDIIMGAEDRLYTLEYDLFCDVRDQIAAEVLRIQSTAKAIAGIDVFTSLSTVSMRNNYVKPKINEKGLINIKNGRHPVVEKMIKDSLFVANDTYLDNGKNLSVPGAGSGDLAGKRGGQGGDPRGIGGEYPGLRGAV